MRNRYIPTNF